ncbi:ph-response regulator protein palc [Purpureocillium lilacinum]|uniref:pH-response regulator protein palC n=1 Tax=Purpureocillium lilacinum TaxID=33203 RepID=A0A179HAX0_PURLI|nr:ph-response regulator protein palc [Purpureocillium lilacinum]OAQ87317.1 ph-response regulator protein palc [Purpureocillium lilacinum]OAQ95268.1 ph-response regulator protein palc [Purpureocillium lilacinum]PWI71307.1 pH-response regulator protein palC [Purpureocillium lilacinum]
MPFPFVLPTTSAFSFSSCFGCDSHPSLPIHASTQRGVMRDALKKHKRLPAASRSGDLAIVIASLDAYIPYLLAVDAGVSPHALVGGESINVVLKTAPSISWRPTLSGDIVPGKERPRVKINSLEYEIFFVLSTLAFAYVSTARSILQPLYVINGEFIGSTERTAAVQTANKHLLDAASLYDYLATRSEQISSTPPCVDVSPATARALASLALAEATLLAVTKDDPYPAAVAQGRNKSDKEWMFKSPDIPKTKAHLNARLCLAASDHAAKAASLCQSAGAGTTKMSQGLTRYVEDLRRTSRAKACRFFGIHAEIDGNTAEGIGWLRAGFAALGVEPKDRESKKGLSFSRFKKDLTEKREDRRVEKETAWGADAGRLEETRILELLDDKWNKINDTMNTQLIPPVNSLLAKMPSGREICILRPYQPPVLDRDVLESMRAPPDGDDELGHELSSDDEAHASPAMPVGAYPGTSVDYGRTSSTPGSSAYY